VVQAQAVHCHADRRHLCSPSL